MDVRLFTHFAAKLLLDCAPSLSLFPLAPVWCGTDFAHQPLHATNCEVEVEGERCAQMLEHLVAFGRLVFQKELIDDDCGICLFAQPGDPLSVNFQPNEFPCRWNLIEWLRTLGRVPTVL
jgi:hypothetical protein